MFSYLNKSTSGSFSSAHCCLFLFIWFWFLFKWHLSASVSRPTGMASGWRTAGAGEPAVRWALQPPTAETRDREAPPFLEQKHHTSKVNIWQKQREEKKERGLLCEWVNLISQDSVRLLDAPAALDQFADILSLQLNSGQSFLSLLIWLRFLPDHSYIIAVCETIEPFVFLSDAFIHLINLGK